MRKKPGERGPFISAVRFAWDRVDDPKAYPYSLPAVRALEGFQFHERVTFFVGENGSGKSTLLEALAVACRFNPEGGSKNFNFATASSHSDLHDVIQIGKMAIPSDGFFLRAESFYNVSSEIDRLGVSRWYGGQSLHTRSHGESFFALFKERFFGPGLYFLDEPEAALSPARQIKFLGRLHRLVQDGSQFVIATHSPILMAYPDCKLMLLEKKGMREVELIETEHYCLTRAFLNNPTKYLEMVLAEASPVGRRPSRRTRAGS